MAVITLPASTKTLISSTIQNNLANSAYAATPAVDISAIDAVDVVIEVETTTIAGTLGSNPGVNYFAKISFDGINYSTGPESGTTAIDEFDLFYLGFLPVNTANAIHRKAFSIVSMLGFVPVYFKIISKNSTGLALAASGGSINYVTYTGLST